MKKELMSACGVLCSGCGAYLAASRGLAYQRQVADAWQEIYGLNVPAEKISCGGCLAPDDEVFSSSVRCTARRCCREKGFNSCAECSVTGCALLEKAQSVWDEVPRIGASLSLEDFVMYARPYCGHRERLTAARERKNGAE